MIWTEYPTAQGRGEAIRRTHELRCISFASESIPAVSFRAKVTWVSGMFKPSRFKIDDIALGQQFRAIGGGMWEYAGKAPTKVPEPHVRLVRLDDRRTVKIIALDALIDRSLFEPVG